MADAVDPRPGGAERGREPGDRAPALRHRADTFRQRLVGLWERAAAPPPGSTSTFPAVPLTEQLDTAAPIRVSGRGGAFNFQIQARCVWSSSDLARDALRGHAHYWMPAAARRLTALAAVHARHFPPHRVAELEVELQQALSDADPWRFETGRAVVTCRAHVWVHLDERARKLALPYWEKLVTLDCECDVDLKRAEYADRLGREWARIIRNLADAAAPAGAAGDDPAGVARKLAAEHRAAVHRLDDLLGEVLREGRIL
ncbi:hypothetical protein MRQ36_25555 [Micromonospora sp. R77]|uniref:hypothetical protein n=1 Tax=Micromonospora sp. R77 TaxID=2925836 RepID=UPI001F60A27C|nr:hypothetical protein [Micromonospora sp. R77]MCI4065741.1 hypothetical protein [Micromonospora sp. R77]